MSNDVLQALAGANPGAFAPAPDQSDPGVVHEGGVQVFEKGGSAPSPGGTPANDAGAALLSALQQVIKPQKEVVELGETVAVEGRDGNAQTAPQPQQPVVEQQVAQPTQQFQPDVYAIAQQAAEARARLERAEAIAAEATAWRQEKEPLFNALQQKWPEIQGLQAKNAELQAQAEFEAAQRQYVQDSYAAGNMPNLEAFQQQHRLNQTLAKAANIEQTVEATMSRMLDQRDQAYQQQVAQQQQQQYVQQVQSHFVQSWAQLEQQAPALKGREGLRKAVWAEWSANPQVPVSAVAAQYVRDLQVQAVNQQASQMTRAEVAASVPRTVTGGSGAAAAAVPAHPAGWGQMGFRERLAFNTTQGRR